MPIRQPIVCVLGHVDTGKTSLLDELRKTTVQLREAGGMTQHIGASFFPIETLKQIIGPYMDGFKTGIEIPGLLIVDTPGHEAFTNLRRRGGSVADIAILVVDILKGFEAQTLECIDILKARKTPFIVAVNKIDRIPGWKAQKSAPFLKSYSIQNSFVQEDFNNRLYQVMGEFSRLNFKTDRFDHIRDFTMNLALVPTSAKTGEGLSELVMVLVGLTQQFLKKRLQTTDGPAKGSILEVKEEPGLGLTLNTIIYDGTLNNDDLVVVGGKEGAVSARIRTLLVPKPLDEMRDPRDKFTSVERVYASSGVKIVAPGLESALAGAPLFVVPPGEEVAKYCKLITEEIGRIRIAKEIDGVIVKADTLGSLEALAQILRTNNVQVRSADIGDISKRDVIEASVVKTREPLVGAILAFGVKVLPDAEIEAAADNVPIFKEPIIYNLIDNYLTWVKNKREAKSEAEFEALVKPGKLMVLPNCIFRRAKPAIFGVEILGGRLKPRVSLLRVEDTSELGELQQIQDQGKAVGEAKAGAQVAISMDKPVAGRHLFEKDILYVKIPEKDAKVLLTTHLDDLNADEQELLKEYVNIMRKKVPFWAGH
ncbi:MAG: translation initiation factor IF-2 [Candidatus Bathyarchaeota archaeon]|nr:translation initiation factor IF-2 [Candidatus Bathyarchaeota archaeon]MDD4326550.1 translation initiation factor IF-2 [Candidatus Bathyarchaeota archaeon]MDI9576777.1 translation initiation factor IF-2 [Thermoproteota archaeon]NLD66964.1 translation initiation factor IF-2 [Thermoproteota archaeon]